MSKKAIQHSPGGLKVKHRQLSDVLRTRIAVQFRPGDRFLTVREIAKKYDVSMLTSHRSVQELVAQNLLVAHQTKGFFIAPGADRLHTAIQSPSVTVFTRDSFSSLDVVSEDFVRGIREKLPFARISLELLPQRDVLHFLELHIMQNEHSRARGYVLRSVDGTVQEFFAKNSIPAVVTGYVQPHLNLPAITRDERQIAYAVTRFLLGKGHEHIAYMEVDVPSGGHDQRLEGYQLALSEARKFSPTESRGRLAVMDQLKRHGDLIGSPAEDAAQNWARAIRVPLRESDILEAFRTILDSGNTALILGNERQAAWVLRAVHRWNVKVPRDIALVCLADGILTETMVPRMTSVPRYDYEAGAWIGTAFAKLLAGDPLPEQKCVITGEIKEYETT